MERDGRTDAAPPRRGGGPAADVGAAGAATAAPRRRAPHLLRHETVRPGKLKPTRTTATPISCRHDRFLICPRNGPKTKFTYGRSTARIAATMHRPTSAQRYQKC